MKTNWMNFVEKGFAKSWWKNSLKKLTSLPSNYGEARVAQIDYK